MLRTVIYYALLMTLCLGGVWGLWQVLQTQPKIAINHDKTVPQQTEKVDEAGPNQHTSAHRATTASDPADNGVAHVRKLLNVGHYALAANSINEHYSDFSVFDLEQIRHEYLQVERALTQQGASEKLIELFVSESDVFNDLNAWLKLGRAAADAQNWGLAFRATLTASGLQNDSIGLTQLQSSLVTIAANFRAQLERQGDKLGVHQIYDDLYKAHPSYPRFQLELAYSYLRLSNERSARPLLEQLSYDLEFGELSRSLLTSLDARKTLEPPTNPDIFDNSSNIRVGLRRSGTNMLATVEVSRRPVTLLLDTGASITALDTRLIEQLGLQATGQTIRLSTANGMRTAQLYNSKMLRLGQFTILNHVVASIDLEPNAGFSGLLGTDLLSSLSDYSYLIDNEQSALIFRPKG